MPKVGQRGIAASNRWIGKFDDTPPSVKRQRFSSRCPPRFVINRPERHRREEQRVAEAQSRRHDDRHVGAGELEEVLGVVVGLCIRRRNLLDTAAKP